MTAKKTAKKKTAKKVSAAPKPVVKDEAAEPLDIKPDWPKRVHAVDPSGNKRTLKVGPGIDGPYLVEDGQVVPNPNGYGGWKHVGEAK